MMDTRSKAKIGEALYPFLSPFHEVDGCILKNAWERVVDDEIEAIELQFESGVLTIEVDGSDDTINLSMASATSEGSICVSHLDPWLALIGKPFGWGWLGINQQGYLDGVSLSFESVTPQICITSISSSLRLTCSYQVIPRKSQHPSKPAREQAAAEYA